MKALVVYSSRTGNTKMIAEAIYQIMPAGSHIVAVEEAPDPSDYSFLVLGFWVDKGGPDAKMAAYMSRVHGKQVGLFGTLGAYPDSDHARSSMEIAKSKVQGNTVLGTFICQGKVDPKLLAAMEKMPDAQVRHPMTPERKARIEEAKKHPNAEDCKTAQRVFSSILAKILEDENCEQHTEKQL